MKGRGFVPALDKSKAGTTGNLRANVLDKGEQVTRFALYRSAGNVALLDQLVDTSGDLRPGRLLVLNLVLELTLTNLSNPFELVEQHASQGQVLTNLYPLSPFCRCGSATVGNHLVLVASNELKLDSPLKSLDGDTSVLDQLSVNITGRLIRLVVEDLVCLRYLFTFRLERCGAVKRTS